MCCAAVYAGFCRWQQPGLLKLVVGISKSQHPGRHSLQESCKATGNLKLGKTWLTNNSLQESPDSSKVAVIPVHCDTETKVDTVFTKVAFLSMQE